MLVASAMGRPPLTANTVADGPSTLVPPLLEELEPLPNPRPAVRPMPGLNQ